MDSLFRDLKYAVRLLTRAPGFALVVIAALALAIGANTAVFSVLNAILFDPLPYPDPGRVVSMATRFTGIGIPDDRNFTSPLEFQEVQRYANSLTAVAAFTPVGVNLRVGDLPERYVGAAATAQFFDVLGVKPQLGRGFAQGEDQEGNETVLVLGHDLWQRRFNGDRNVLGRSIQVNGRAYTIVGVMPQGFSYPDDAEAWVPLAFTPAQLTPNSRGNHFLRVIARVKPSLSLEQSLADMDRVSSRIVEGAPQYPYAQFGFKVLMRPLLEDYAGDLRPALMLLMGAVGFVLLIACANVANLMLVRATARAREIGIRAALGAGRGRLIRQLLTESVVLSLAGAAAGLAVAWFSVRGMVTLGGASFPRLANAHVDGLTLAFTTVVAVATGILFGLAPAWHASRGEGHDPLRDRGTTASSAANNVRRVLVTAEIAMALALVCGAGLLIKSFVKLQQVDPGFKPEGVMTMRVVLPRPRYNDPADMRRFHAGLMERVRGIAGVESVGAISGLPLSGDTGSGTTTMDTAAVPPDNASPEADRRVVTPGYFETMGTRLIAGRFFEPRDREASELVVIVDETLADTYWPGQSALGKRVKYGGPGSTQPWRTIVGVVRHTRLESLERPSRVQVYLPLEQAPQTGMSLVLKSRLDQGTLAATIQREIVNIDPEQPIYAVRPMTELTADAVRRRQLVMAMLAVFSGIALALAAVGIYGVMAYWVSQRQNEIGIRMALGATRGNVLGLVLAQSTPVVLVGVAAGLAGSLALTRMMGTLLFDVAPNDTATLVWVSAALIATGLLATAVPALRATRIHPMEALRQE